MDYIRVADDDNEQDPIELPVEEDGTMLLSTVSAQFPGACGLKYRNQETGSWRGLRMSDGRIQAPGGMWENTIYLVVYPKGTDNKRKGDESSGNPAGKTRRLEVKKNQDLVVLGLPWRTTEEELKTYFEQFGEVVFSEVKHHRDTGKSKGFGFIRFAEAEVGRKVMGEKHMIGGRYCDVKIPDARVGDDNRPELRKLFVRRLPSDVTDDDLREYFSEFGVVTEVFLPKPHRGFAFVTFDNVETAQMLKDQDHIIKGHSVQLNNAEPKGRHRQFDDQFGGSTGFGGGFQRSGGGGGGRFDRDRDYDRSYGRDFRDFRDGDRGSRGRGGSSGRFGDSRTGNMEGVNPMAIAAALSQAGWSMVGNMLAQGMGPGQGHGGGTQGGTATNSQSSSQMQGSHTDGLGGGYGSQQSMTWSQGGQGDGMSSGGGGFGFANQGKGNW